jgi:hypothetical protein
MLAFGIFGGFFSLSKAPPCMQHNGQIYNYLFIKIYNAYYVLGVGTFATVGTLNQ